MVSRNASEMQREIEERSEQLKLLEQSRNRQSLYHQQCGDLRSKRRKFREDSLRMCKKDKEKLLNEIHNLERKLGFELTKYNSS